jgi:creatinine amidohydrolase
LTAAQLSGNTIVELLTAEIEITMTIYPYERLLVTEFEARLNERPLLVVPFGTLEWHSYHLPLGLDGLVAESVARRIADLSDAILAPVSYWAVGGLAFPYTLKLPIDVIEPLLETALEQFAEMGFRAIVTFTGHFGIEQLLVLKRVAVNIMRRTPITILPIAPYDLVTDVWTGDHAGIGETSLLWSFEPELIHLDRLPDNVNQHGIVGRDPRGEASADRGRELHELIAARAALVAARLLTETGAVERNHYVEMLQSTVRVLEEMTALRETHPRSVIPSLTTPDYLAACAALYSGEYRQGKAQADHKLAELLKFDIRSS